MSAAKGIHESSTDDGSPCRLLDCLRDWGPLDWQLASVACQALWNCSEDGGALSFGERHSHSLLCLLSRYLSTRTERTPPPFLRIRVTGVCPVQPVL